MVPSFDSSDDRNLLKIIKTTTQFVTPSASPDISTPPLRTSEESSSTDSHHVLIVSSASIAAVCLVAMSSAFLYYLCRCVALKRKKRKSHMVVPELAGVMACQPIQFVVPTTIAISENTEESDCSSGGYRTLPDMRRRRTMSGFHINPEDLQHGLYEGVRAVSEQRGTFLGDLGRVGFRLRYDPMRHQLILQLLGASGLPCHFLRTTANPCAKVVMLPERTPKYVSKVQRNTTDPVFDETYVFVVRRDDLPNKKLKIGIWDFDKFSRKCLVGQVVYSLADSGMWNGEAVSTGDIWAELKPEVTAVSAGELLLSLCYDPDSCNLRLSVLKARGIDTQRDAALYAKVTLYVRRKLARSRKTPSCRKMPEVEFRDSNFDIHAPQNALGQVDLLVTLCEKKGPGIGSRKVLGRTQVGGSCLCDQGLQHWQDMLLSPKSTCAQWHSLCPG